MNNHHPSKFFLSIAVSMLLIQPAFSADKSESKEDKKNGASKEDDKTKEAKDPNAVKQPVFVICPYKTGYSAWSLYFLVDKNNPQKISQMGLEKLKKVNSKDMKYAEVIEKQKDAKTERETISTLKAAEFKTGKLEVKKDKALTITLESVKEGYRLNLKLRVGAGKHFHIGGKQKEKCDVHLKYNKEKKKWEAEFKTLTGPEGNDVLKDLDRQVTGIAFPVKGTGIYRILAVLKKDGKPVLVMNR